jgi:hypothetical protein
LAQYGCFGVSTEENRSSIIRFPLLASAMNELLTSGQEGARGKKGGREMGKSEV